MKILIVDDAIIVHIVLEKILRAAGHEVLGAVANGEAALELLKAASPDVVILDLSMPGETNGYTVLKTIKQMYPSVRVIIYTAVRMKEKVKYAMDLGADLYLTKPVKPEVIIDALKQLAVSKV